MKTLTVKAKPLAATIRLWTNIALVWSFSASYLLAQPAQYDEYGQEIGPPKSYVSVYIIMIFFVGLALTLICRTSRRQADARVTE